MIVGLDIGGHHIAGALLAPDGRGIVTETYRHRATDRDATSDSLLDVWAELIDAIAASAPDKEIAGVGIAMPGPFDYRTGVAYFENNGKFQSLYGVNVREQLQRRVSGRSEIRFLNDATAFAVGCAAMGAARDAERMLAVTLGTGLGAAFLKRGIPVVQGRAGEVPPEGCLWHLPFKDGIADDYVSSRWILKEAEARLGVRPAGVAEVADMARRDQAARDVFEEYGANLAAIVAPWARGFGAEAIVLGGRITGAFDLFSPTLRQGLAAGGVAAPILIHENTEDAAIVGAGTTFDPAFWLETEARLPRR